MGRRGNSWLTLLLAAGLAMPVVAQQLSQSGGKNPDHDDVSDYLAAIRAPALHRQKLDDLYRSANGELANADYAAAEADFRNLYSQEPQNTRGLEGIALVFLGEQRPGDALTLMQNELDKSPQRIDVLLAFVRIAVKDNAPDAAAKALSRALATLTLSSKTSSELYLKLSEVSAAQGHADESFAALQMANRLSPRDVLIAMSLGEALEARGELSEAARIYRAALAGVY
jgi:predicted Zn-dependent protease